MSEGKNKAFMADPVAFMKKYSVAPSDDIDSYIGDKAGAMATTASPADYVYSAMEAAKKVAWINLRKKPRGSGVSYTFVPLAEGVIGMEPTFTPTAGHVKSYFLPWTAGGGIIKMAIPTMGTVPAAQDASYFFTAAITGCSVFIQGTRQTPVVSHAGGNTGQNDPNAAATFWRNLMTLHGGADGAIVQEVNKTHYISGMGNGGGTKTANSEAFVTWLKANSPKDLDVQWGFPWGCVMGVRDGAGDWTFYLQENATIFFSRWHKKHVLSKTKVQGTTTAAARPMIFREIFPNGLHHIFIPGLNRAF